MVRGRVKCLVFRGGGDEGLVRKKFLQRIDGMLPLVEDCVRDVNADETIHGFQCFTD